MNLLEIQNIYVNQPLHIACIYSNSVELVKHLVEEVKCDVNAKGQNGYTPLHCACEKNQIEIVRYLTSLSSCHIEIEDNNGNRPLHIACIVSNNVELVKHLVEEVKCDVNAKQQYGRTPLHCACEKNQIEIVRYLTSLSSCDIEIENNYGNRPLHIACLGSNNVELVKHLVEEVKCDVNAKGQYGRTPLHWACEKNQIEIVRYLTSLSSCHIEIEDNNDNRPLHIACLFSNNVELIKHLVEEVKCDVNAKGQNALHCACRNYQIEIVRYLTSLSSCHIEIEDKNDNRPLHIACLFSKNVELVKHLVEEVKCDVNAKGQYGYTPLHCACHNNQIEIVRYLTSLSSCHIEIDDKNDNRPLHIACLFSNNVELIKHLVEEVKCDVNAKGQYGCTPLHCACEKNQIETVRYLTSLSSCHIEIEDNNDNRPLHIACLFSNNVELIKHLVEEVKCDVNAKEQNGYTPLHCACRNYQIEIVRYLTSLSSCHIEIEDKNDNRPLHIACLFSKNVELVKHLVEEVKCDVNAKGQYGYTPLHCACHNNQIEIVRYLTSLSSCHIEIDEKNDNRPLHIACLFSNNVELIKHLVEEAKCDVNAKGQYGCTPLHWACEKNQIEIVRYLTSLSSCHIEIEDNNDNRPLHIACLFSNNVELIKHLVEEVKCDVNAKEQNGYTPLHCACRNYQIEIVRYLTSLSSCHIEIEDKNDNRPLHIACLFSKNVELVKHLVEEVKCDVNAKGQYGYTPLHCACHNNQIEIVRYLTSLSSCVIEIDDKNDNWPLHIACLFSNNVELIKHLVEEVKCDVNAKGQYGYTPLHCACHNNQIEIVRYLTSLSSCDIEMKDKNDNGPLHIACLGSNNVELVKHLVEEVKCDVNAKGQNGYTPLHCACEKNQIEIVRYLTSLSSCHIEIENNDGNRPLHIACLFSNNIELVKHLVEIAQCKICDINPVCIPGNNMALFQYLSTYNVKLSVGRSFNLRRSSFNLRMFRAIEFHNKSIMSSGTSKLRIVKCILTGPPGAGKSTLKKRLLNESIAESYDSTGVADAAVQVNNSFRELEQEGAVITGHNKENSMKWTRQELDEETVFIFNNLISDKNSLKDSTISSSQQEELPIPSPDHNPQENLEELPIPSPDHNLQESLDIDNLINTDQSVIEEQENLTISVDITKSEEITSSAGIEEVHETLDINDSTDDIDNNEAKIKGVQVLSHAVQKIPVTKRKMYEEKYAETNSDYHTMLNIIDTGGQPEFHEILPALITGPAINLLVFKLTEDLTDRYKIVYRSSDSGDSDPYETSLTHEEVIFRSLASIACLRQNTIGWSFDEATVPVKDESKPAAFLIATHKDCVNDDKVAKVNEHLKQKIKSSKDLFSQSENLIQFSNEDQVIHPLNTIKDEQEIENLRNNLENVISSNFKELLIPASWCALSIKLRKSKKPIFLIDTCYKLALECGITDRNDFNSALWYLHYRVGTIMYYPEVEGLSNIIITDLQILFDRITRLITQCFTFKKSNNAAVTHTFREQGQFDDESLKKLSTVKGDPLTYVRLVSLLKHLHIIAGPIKVQKTKYYFMPCALKPIKLDESEKDTFNISPLHIWFECGYCPVGIFCCLVVYLLDQSSLQWKLLDKNRHYRNKISFKVGQYHDRVTIISHATFLEICISELIVEDLNVLCGNIVSSVEEGLNIVTQSLNYTYKSKHMFGFPCNCHHGVGPHPAVLTETCVVADCVLTDERLCLDSRHTIWSTKVCYNFIFLLTLKLLIR